ncbi:MAG: phage tail protein [Desulfuromonadales bacterium]|nr:phage tail protein [Desulfuromonadales bacterium]
MIQKKISRKRVRSLLAIGAICLSTGPGLPTKAIAGGTEPFIGEIVCTAATFCPRYWAECNGQVMNISTNQALFSLLGTTYGGNGTSTFALPDLRGRTMLGTGTGTGLSPRTIGNTGGAESVTLAESQIPTHGHGLYAHGGTQKSASPTGNVAGVAPTASAIYTYSAADATLGATAVGSSGSGQAHENRQPYLAVKCCIAINGLFPSRN